MKLLVSFLLSCCFLFLKRENCANIIYSKKVVNYFESKESKYVGEFILSEEIIPFQIFGFEEEILESFQFDFDTSSNFLYQVSSFDDKNYFKPKKCSDFKKIKLNKKGSHVLFISKSNLNRIVVEIISNDRKSISYQELGSFNVISRYLFLFDDNDNILKVENIKITSE